MMNVDSVKARLKNFAIKSGCTFQEALTYYGLERTIYRISISEYADNFVLTVIDQAKCKGCGRCIGACNFDAIYSQYDSANEMLDRKMAEYAAAVCAGRPCFHISLVQDVSPNCDCHGENDAPILPDIGMFASFDPVALDQACADACLNATPLPNNAREKVSRSSCIVVHP